MSDRVGLSNSICEEGFCSPILTEPVLDTHVNETRGQGSILFVDNRSIENIRQPGFLLSQTVPASIAPKLFNASALNRLAEGQLSLRRNIHPDIRYGLGTVVRYNFDHQIGWYYYASEYYPWWSIPINAIPELKEVENLPAKLIQVGTPIASIYHWAIAVLSNLERRYSEGIVRSYLDTAESEFLVVFWELLRNLIPQEIRLPKNNDIPTQTEGLAKIDIPKREVKGLTHRLFTSPVYNGHYRETETSDSYLFHAGVAKAFSNLQDNIGLILSSKIYCAIDSFTKNIWENNLRAASEPSTIEETRDYYQNLEIVVYLILKSWCNDMQNISDSDRGELLRSIIIPEIRTILQDRARETRKMPNFQLYPGKEPSIPKGIQRLLKKVA